MEETAYRQFVELEQTHFWMVSRRRIFFHLLDREIGRRQDLKIMDVGCGAGGMLAPLSQYGEVTGIDTSEELVARCQERGFARVFTGSAYDLPAPAASLDLITLFDTIEHIPDDVAVLAECREKLAPGGLVFISVPAYQFLYANNDRVAHHERRYTATDLRRKLTATRLAPVKVTYFNTLLFPLILPAVLLKKARERWSDPGDATNLSHPLPPSLNRLLTGVMSSERRLLQRVDAPFGHSIVAMARRNA